MKKYIFTENQAKYVVDNLIKEQTDNQSTIMIVQCFLNQVMKANLIVDGKTGENSKTKQALQTFQQQKVKLGHNITIDGVWGYNTQNTLTLQEKQVWEACRRKYERL